MLADTIEDAIYAQLHIAAQKETSLLYGARMERYGVRGQEIAMQLPNGTERYLYIRNPQRLLDCFREGLSR